MDIKIVPYTFDPSCDCSPEAVGSDKNLHIGKAFTLRSLIGGYF